MVDHPTFPDASVIIPKRLLAKLKLFQQLIIKQAHYVATELCSIAQQAAVWLGPIDTAFSQLRA